MRILVISDSHGRARTVEEIIRMQPDAKHIFFLGDVTRDVEDLVYEFNDRQFHIVSGNCDYFSDYPNTDIADIAGIKILFTHGHSYGVKGGTGGLLSAARQRNCTIALYGHTHISKTEYADGVYLVNPGSCACSRSGANSYAVIDIEKGGIMPIIIEV